MLLLGACASFAAEDRIEVIELRNRPAAQVMPLVQPLLQPGEALSGTGFKLILRASPATIAEVRNVLADIDGALRNLLISVRHGDARSTERSGAGATIRYHSDTGAVVRGQARQDRKEVRSDITQRVRVLEGNPAFIHAGQARVEPYLYGATGPDTGTGFYVTPRLNGERVNLEISPYRSSLRMRGTIADVQRAGTVVSGRIGEWIYLGGAVDSTDAGRRGILYGADTARSRETGISVMVEVVE